MRFRISVAAVLLLLAVTSACDQRAPTDPARALDPRAAILDGSSGGNPHFYFLPPVVKKASFSGVFNGKLAPTVEICTNTQLTAAGRCVSLLARFKRFPGPGDNVDPVEVSLTGQHYVLNWKTNQFAVPQNAPFRLVVLVGEVQLGYVDLIQKSGNNYRNYTTGDVLSKVGGTVPIKFRIENGALCNSTSTDCFEGSVGPAGGTFTITRPDGTKPAGTQFPAGALNETVTLIIERYFGECLPTDVPQYQGCYRFRTVPHVENFALPATVGVCLFDASALSYFNSGQLRLWKWSEIPGESITELERVTIDYLECPPLTQIGMRSNSPLLLGAARAGALLLKPLASLIMPREAYALVGYEGGKLINFSRIGWVRPLSVEVTGGNGQTGMAGSALQTPVTSRVINKYGSLVQGVPGRAITFTPSGDGTANPPATFTDGAGQASAIWTLSTTPGANTLVAHAPTSRVVAPTPYEAQATAAATGQVGATLLWLPPMVPTWDESGTDVTGLHPTITVSSGEQSAFSLQLLQILVTLNTIETSDGYSAIWNFGTIDPSKIYRVTVNLGGSEVGRMDLLARGSYLRNIATDGVVLNLNDYSSLQVRFRLLQ